MKTLKTLATFAVALISSLNVNANVLNPVNALATTLSTSINYTHVSDCNAVYSKQDSNGKTKYYTDDMGRVTAKIHFYMGADGNWTPDYAYSVSYCQDENVLTYAKWNGRSFTKNPVQEHYNAAEFPLLIGVPTAAVRVK